MDDIIKENRAKASVWGVALVVIALFVGAAMVAGMFSSAEVANVVATK